MTDRSVLLGLLALLGPAVEQSQPADRIVPLYDDLVHAECPRRPADVDGTVTEDDPAARRERIKLMARVPSMVRTALGDARAALAGPSVIVCLGLARPNRVTRELGGVSAFAAPEGAMYVFVDPTVSGWSRLLPFTVAHEYHHLTAFARSAGAIDPTVQGRIVFEGKADVFASQRQPGVRRPWHTDYASDDQRRCWGALHGQLSAPGNTTEFTNDYLIAWTGRAPRYCGYAAGRRLVLRYLASRPELPPAEWSTVPAATIVAGVGADWP